MTRVIHTGDTHLGYQQYHLPARREDFLDAFRRVARDAVEDDLDAVVHAGDLFHDRRPDLPDLLGTLSVLRELAEADVPFLAVVGNHESKRDTQWLDLFESLGLATRLSDEPQVVGDTAFYGLDYVPRSQRDDLDYAFESHDADHAALVAHGLFQPLVPDYGTVEWDVAEVLESATVDFDAMLLGDEHAPRKAEIGGTWVTYCGSTERASADEREDRGYNIVEFDDGEAHVTRRGIPTRGFVFVDVELAEGEGAERVRERVGQHDLTDAVVVVTVEGEGEPLEPARVEEFAAERGALVARVTDRREVADEAADVEVSFADPDEAVRDRVRELGLSPAARDLDETIRASKVADSNVADAVEDRVQELVEDDDPAAFESAPADEAAEGPETEMAADRLADEGSDGGSSVAHPASDKAGATDSRVESVADDENVDDEIQEETTEDDPATEPPPTTDRGDGDGSAGQASMEDYL